MLCPVCHCPDHRVLSTDRASTATRRRRKCDRCGHRWSTVEISAERHDGEADALAKIRAALARVPA